jgi:hypothetical protein
MPSPAPSGEQAMAGRTLWGHSFWRAFAWFSFALDFALTGLAEVVSEAWAKQNTPCNARGVKEWSQADSNR